MDTQPTFGVQEADGMAAADLVRSQFVVAYPSLPAETATPAEPRAQSEAAENGQQEGNTAPEPSQVTGAEVR